MKTIVALHGLQGSGKTTLANNLIHHCGGLSGIVSIKNSFKKYADYIIKETGPLLPWHSKELAFKELQRAISTWGERFEPQIWSNLYIEDVNQSRFEIVVTDDVRTDMNLTALRKLSETNNVLVVRLLANEEIRKSRVSVWREISDYTERLLHVEADLPSIDVDTGSLGTSEVLEAVLARLENGNG